MHLILVGLVTFFMQAMPDWTDLLTSIAESGKSHSTIQFTVQVRGQAKAGGLAIVDDTDESKLIYEHPG